MGPDFIILIIMMVALGLYGVLGGADFGAGVWEFTTCLDDDKRDRQLISDAIGPVWEANHVWLVFVLIIMFNGFPLAFAAVSRALWIPLLLALVGIVFRGAGFVVRAYAEGADWLRNLASTFFALGSTLTPFFMGTAIGAVSTGTLPIAADGTYSGNQLTDWITPLSLFSGILAVGLCSYLAAVYLTREASLRADPGLLKTWRSRALATGIWIGILAWLGLAMCKLEAPILWSGLVARGWPLILLSVLTGLSSLKALRSNKFRRANLLAAMAVAAVLLGWGLGTYPALVLPHVTIQNSKAPDVVLWSMASCILAGSGLLFPALWYLMRIFKSQRKCPPVP